MLLTDGEWLALGQWQFRATTRTAAATATGHSPESLEGRVEAWRSVDAATGRYEKVNIPGAPNCKTSQLLSWETQDIMFIFLEQLVAAFTRRHASVRHSRDSQGSVS